MTDGTSGSPRPSPGGRNVRTIGPEPSGATPIDDEDLLGLLPDFVANRADLNQVEFENITSVLPWAYRRARRVGPEVVLSYAFMMDLHRRMFGDVWAWAGTHRWRITNIGVDPSQIVMQSGALFDDARFWQIDGAPQPFVWRFRHDLFLEQTEPQSLAFACSVSRYHRGCRLKHVPYAEPQ